MDDQEYKVMKLLTFAYLYGNGWTIPSDDLQPIAMRLATTKGWCKKEIGSATRSICRYHISALGFFEFARVRGITLDLEQLEDKDELKV